MFIYSLSSGALETWRGPRAGDAALFGEQSIYLSVNTLAKEYDNIMTLGNSMMAYAPTSGGGAKEDQQAFAQAH